MRIVDLETAYNFHPFYNEFKEQNFDVYVMQTFIRTEDDAKIEIRFTGGINKTPETLLHGRFITKDIYQSEDKVIKITEKPIVNLNYIAIEKDEYKRQGRGTELLNWFVNLCDKYDYSVTLDIDPKFGVSFEVLEKFYKKAGFIKTSQDAMARPCLSDRKKNYESNLFADKLDLLYKAKLLIQKAIKLYTDFDDYEFGDIKESKIFKDKAHNHEREMLNIITQSIVTIESSNAISYSLLYSLYNTLNNLLGYIELYEEEFDNNMEDIKNIKCLTKYINNYLEN